MTNDKQMRSAFEQHLENQNVPRSGISKSNGNYADWNIQRQWVAWQAACAWQSQQAQGGGRRAEVIEALEESYAEDSSLDWMRDAAAMLRHPPAPVAVRFVAACSGLQYENPQACGQVSAVIVGDKKFDLPEPVAVPDQLMQRIKDLLLGVGHHGVVITDEGQAYEIGEQEVAEARELHGILSDIPAPEDKDHQQAALFRAHNGGDD